MGGPVTVTHPDIIRYFMTIPEAASLVLVASTFTKPGRIFVLDMGTPVKIDDLARNMIKLSGLKPDEDIQVVYRHTEKRSHILYLVDGTLTPFIGEGTVHVERMEISRKR